MKKSRFQKLKTWIKAHPWTLMSVGAWLLLALFFGIMEWMKHVQNAFVSLIILFFSQGETPKPKPKTWAVRFEWTSKDPEKDKTPTMLISLCVKAPTEGEAVLQAFRHVETILNNISRDQITFFEAQEK